MGYSAQIRVKPDIVKGCVVADTLTELVLDRVFQVSGLGSFEPSNRVAIALSAVDAVDPSKKVPQPQDKHPNYPPAFVVERHTSDPSYESVNVFIRYRWRRFPAAYLKSVAGSLRSVPIIATNPDGSQAMLTYKPTPTSDPIVVPAIINQDIDGAIFTFRFLEQVDPEQFNRDWAGTFNINTWRGYAPRTLKILPVQGQSDDNIWYMNNYSIEYRDDTWDEYVFFRDELGVIPPAVLADVKTDGSVFTGNGWCRLKGNGRQDYLADFASVFQGKIDPGTPIAAL